eukprot:1965887-Amphidinium_carterae.1
MKYDSSSSYSKTIGRNLADVKNWRKSYQNDQDLQDMGEPVAPNLGSSIVGKLFQQRVTSL